MALKPREFGNHQSTLAYIKAYLEGWLKDEEDENAYFPVNWPEIARHLIRTIDLNMPPVVDLVEALEKSLHKEDV